MPRWVKTRGEHERAEEFRLALPEAVRDASRCRCIHEATSIAPQKRL